MTETLLNLCSEWWVLSMMHWPRSCLHAGCGVCCIFWRCVAMDYPCPPSAKENSRETFREVSLNFTVSRFPVLRYKVTQQNMCNNFVSASYHTINWMCSQRPLCWKPHQLIGVPSWGREHVHPRAWELFTDAGSWFLQEDFQPWDPRIGLPLHWQ